MSSWCRSSVSRCVESNATLEQLDTHAKCPICYDYFTHAVSLPCFHSFCSICVRRSLYFHAVCPLCHAASTAAELRANFGLAALTAQVRGIRKQLTEELTTSISEAWAERSSATASRRSADGAIGVDDDDSDEPPTIEHESTTGNTTTITTTTSSSIASVFALDKVECPICNLKIVSSLINRHLDACLGKEENRRPPPSSEYPNTNLTSADSTSASTSNSSTAGRLPFPVYNMLSEKQLRKLLTQQGFPSSSSGGGVSLPQDRESLVRRHREFILRHNAELDSSDGRPAGDATIVKDIIRKERVLTSAHTGKQAKQSLLLEAFVPQEAATNANTTVTGMTNNASTPFAAATSAAAKTSRKRGAHAATFADSTDVTSVPPMDHAPRTRARRTSPRKAVPAHVDAEDLTADDSPTDAALPVAAAACAADKDEMQIDAPPPAPAPAITPTPTMVTSSADPESINEVRSVHAPAPAAVAISSPATFSSSASASSDPWSALIAAYEAQHGPRKRWRRKWGEDESLYATTKTPLPPPPTSAAPAAANNAPTNPTNDSHSTGAAPGEPADADDDLVIDTARTARSTAGAKPHKAVFSLFQPKNAAAAEPPSANHASTTTPPTTSGGSSGTKSSSGAIRVPSAVCTQCHAVCRGSFPLGASIICPRCRPNWTEIHQVHARRTHYTPPNIVSSGKPTWQQLASQAQSQTPPSVTPTTTPSPPVASDAAQATAATALSADQKQLIEARRIAALERLHAKKQPSTQVESQAATGAEAADPHQPSNDAACESTTAAGIVCIDG